MNCPIFEIVDTTNEETYFTLGLFNTLEEAVAELERISDPADLGSDGCHDDYCVVEIRRRKIGWCGTGKPLYQKHWTQEYNEDTDDYKWVSKEDFL